MRIQFFARLFRSLQFSVVPLLAAVGVAALSPAQSAQAQIVNWTNFSGGAFSSGANWGGGVAPDTTQTARFNLNATYGVTFTIPALTNRLNVDHGNVTFHLGGQSYYVNDDILIASTGNNANLHVTNGTLTAGDLLTVGHNATGSLSVDHAGTVETTTLRLGDLAGSTGRLFVNDGGLLRASSVILGTADSSNGLIQISAGGTANLGTVNIGNGTLQVNDSGHLITRGSVTLGSATNVGSLQLFGGNSAATWDHNGGTINIAPNGFLAMSGGAANVSGQSNVFVGSSMSLSANAQFNFDSLGSSGITILSNGLLHLDTGSRLHIRGQENSLAINAGGTLTIANGSLLSTRNLTNLGTINLLDGNLEVAEGVYRQNGTDLVVNTFNNGQFHLRDGATTESVRSLQLGNLGGTLPANFLVSSGSQLSTSALSIVGTTGLNSIASVDGAGSRWDSAAAISVGQATGTLNVSNGGVVSTQGNSLFTGVSGAGSVASVNISSGGRLEAGSIDLARVVNSSTSALVTGAGSTMTGTALTVGGSSGSSGGVAVLTVADQGLVQVAGNTRVRNSGTLNIDGGTLVTQNFTRDSTGVVNIADGTLQVQGGIVSFGGGALTVSGQDLDNHSRFVLDGGATTAGISNLTIGSNNRQGTVTVANGSQLSTGALAIGQLGQFHLNGGRLLASSIANNGQFHWNSGQVNLTSSTSLTSSLLNSLLGSSRQLTNGQELTSFQTLTLDSTMQLNGGTLSGFNFVNNGTLTASQGQVTISQKLRNQAGRQMLLSGLTTVSANDGIDNFGTIRLQSAAAQLSGGTFHNQLGGTLQGTGEIASDLINEGIVRVNQGEHLVFSGANNLNVMNMNLTGGTIEFAGSMFNRSSAAITGRGTWIGSSSNPGGLGLINDGLMSFSSGNMDLFGDVELLSDGRVVTSGAGVTTFFDDVLHNGQEIRTFEGSRTVFFGEQSGAGSFTGTGIVEYAGDLRPGNSPATITYEGDVLFNSSVDLFVELGGDSIGLFDRLEVAGDWFVDGNLFVDLIDNFQLGLGQEFVIGEIGGLRIGEFNGLSEGDLVGSFAGRDLFISYTAGDGNDISLFTAAVPEPSVSILALAGMVGYCSIRRRRSNVN